jgi:hypothetical protein
VAILRSVSSTGSSNSVFTCPKPPGVQQGDVLIAFQTCDAVGDGDMSVPTGGTTWQLLGQRAEIEWAGTRVWWKVAGASEPATYRFTQSGVDPEFPFLFSGGVVAIAAIAGADGTTPLIASLENGADNNVGCPSVAATNAPGVTLRWAAAANNSGTWTPPPGHAEQADRRQDGSTASLATRTRTTAGSTGTASFTYISDITLTQSHGFTVDVGGSSVPQPEPPSIPPSADVHYKYVFTDQLTDGYVATLDLDDVTYTRVIGEPGTFSATVNVVNSDIADNVAKVVPRWVDDPTEPDSLSTGPGRTCVHVYRNGVIWGTYVIWRATVSSDGRGDIKVQLSGSTLESYLNAVEIRDDYLYESVDQFEIARGLLTEMQALSSADIGLTLPVGASGVNRDRTYLASEGGTFGQRLKELADTDNGFEWLIETSDPGTGTRSRAVRFGYPKLGSQTDHVFAQPGNVLSWQQEIDGIRGATSYRARGESVSTDASTRSEPLMSSPQNATAHLAAGWPRIDKTVDYSTVKEVGTLNAYAMRWAAERPGAVRVHQISVRLDDTDWTPQNLGDYARVILVNDWWPIRGGGASFNHRWRVIGVSVHATNRGGQESAQFVFEEEVEI